MQYTPNLTAHGAHQVPVLACAAHRASFRPQLEPLERSSCELQYFAIYLRADTIDSIGYQS